MHPLATGALVILLAVGCGGTTAVSGDAAGKPPATESPSFCSTMQRVVELVEPATESPTPEANKARYASLAVLLEQAKISAPEKLRADVATFAIAIRKFDAALAAVGYKLEAIFSTADGAKLAADASHALSPAIVAELTDPCGIDLGAPRSPN